MKTQKKYEAPQTQHAEVELEQGFMSASVFEGGKENAEGVTIEKHGFADPEKAWEGDYSDPNNGGGWD